MFIEQVKFLSHPLYPFLIIGGQLGEAIEFDFDCKKIPEKGHLAGVVEVHFSHLGVIFILGLRVGDISSIALIDI